METVKGTVKALKKDRKGFMLDNDVWYSNKFLAEVECKVGDEVEVVYSKNGNYNNHEQVKVLSKAQGSKVSHSKVQSPELMLLSYVKDYSCTKNVDIKVALKDVMRSYFAIQEILKEPQLFLDNLEQESPKDESYPREVPISLNEDGEMD